MNQLRNKYLVGCLGVVALLMLINSFKPMWQRGRSSKTSPKAQKPAAAPAPVQLASNPPTAAAAPLHSEAAESAPGIDLSRVGWSFDGAPRRDPFQIVGPGPTNLARLYPSATELLTLNGVWWQSGTILAVVNTNQVVREGATIQASKGATTATFKIVNIGAERIWVDGPNGVEEVLFDPTLSLRGIELRLREDADDSFANAKARLNWPYRVVNGATNDAYADPDWETVSGQVLETISPGIYRISVGNDAGAGAPIKLVKNLPLELWDNATVPPVRCKRVGTESYNAKAGDKVTETVPAFDFGVACSPPKNVIDSLKIQKAFLLEQYRLANERRFEVEMQDAEKGDATAQYMLGRRYLYGDGISKDEQQARRWLNAAAAQGNPDAQAKLQLLASQN